MLVDAQIGLPIPKNYWKARMKLQYRQSLFVKITMKVEWNYFHLFLSWKKSLMQAKKLQQLWSFNNCASQQIFGDNFSRRKFEFVFAKKRTTSMIDDALCKTLFIFFVQSHFPQLPHSGPQQEDISFRKPWSPSRCCPFSTSWTF